MQRESAECVDTLWDGQKYARAGLFAMEYMVNTAEAIYHGALYSLVALIESSYQNLLKSFPQAKLILAGGDAALVGSHLYSQHELVEDLVFEGMQLLESAALLIDA